MSRKQRRRKTPKSKPMRELKSLDMNQPINEASDWL